MFRVGLFAFFIALGVVHARADVELDVTHSSYQLRGLSRQAIHEDIHRTAKRASDGIVDGEVTDNIAWRFRFIEAEKVCRVSSDEIMLKLDILLPNWVDEARAEPALRAMWNTYFVKLKAHENGHRKIAVSAAQRISKLAHGAEAPGSCKALEASLTRAAIEIVDEAENAQDEFDAKEVPFSFE